MIKSPLEMNAFETPKYKNSNNHKKKKKKKKKVIIFFIQDNKYAFIILSHLNNRKYLEWFTVIFPPHAPPKEKPKMGRPDSKDFIGRRKNIIGEGSPK